MSRDKEGLMSYDAFRTDPKRLVAYPQAADKYVGPLVSRLKGRHQPVISPSPQFLIYHPSLLAGR
jgi:hypothetical protein